MQPRSVSAIKTMTKKETTVKWTLSSGKEATAIISAEAGAWDDERRLDGDLISVMRTPSLHKNIKVYVDNKKVEDINDFFTAEKSLPGDCAAKCGKVGVLPAVWSVIDAAQKSILNDVTADTEYSVLTKKENEIKKDKETRHAQSIIDRHNTQKEKLTAKEIASRRRNYNNVHNEGGDGYNPYDDYVSTDQYNAIKNKLEV